MGPINLYYHQAAIFVGLPVYYVVRTVLLVEQEERAQPISLMRAWSVKQGFGMLCIYE